MVLPQSHFSGGLFDPIGQGPALAKLAAAGAPAELCARAPLLCATPNAPPALALALSPPASADAPPAVAAHSESHLAFCAGGALRLLALAQCRRGAAPRDMAPLAVDLQLPAACAPEEWEASLAWDPLLPAGGAPPRLLVCLTRRGGGAHVQRLVTLAPGGAPPVVACSELPGVSCAAWHPTLPSQLALGAGARAVRGAVGSGGALALAPAPASASWTAPPFNMDLYASTLFQGGAQDEKMRYYADAPQPRAPECVSDWAAEARCHCLLWQASSEGLYLVGVWSNCDAIRVGVSARGGDGRAVDPWGPGAGGAMAALLAMDIGAADSGLKEADGATTIDHITVAPRHPFRGYLQGASDAAQPSAAGAAASLFSAVSLGPDAFALACSARSFVCVGVLCRPRFADFFASYAPPWGPAGGATRPKKPDGATDAPPPPKLAHPLKFAVASPAQAAAMDLWYGYDCDANHPAPGFTSLLHPSWALLQPALGNGGELEVNAVAQGVRAPVSREADGAETGAGAPPPALAVGVLGLAASALPVGRDTWFEAPEGAAEVFRGEEECRAFRASTTHGGRPSAAWCEGQDTHKGPTLWLLSSQGFLEPFHAVVNPGRLPAGAPRLSLTRLKARSAAAAAAAAAQPQAAAAAAVAAVAVPAFLPPAQALALPQFLPPTSLPSLPAPAPAFALPPAPAFPALPAFPAPAPAPAFPAPPAPAFSALPAPPPLPRAAPLAPLLPLRAPPPRAPRAHAQPPGLCLHPPRRAHRAAGHARRLRPAPGGPSRGHRGGAGGGARGARLPGAREH